MENDDILKQFISKETGKGNASNDMKREINIDTQKEEMIYGREYISIDTDSLPTGKFYKNGTRISIRGATVTEVQEYTVVDNTNIIDVTEKMNKILQRCVRFVHPSGKVGNYKDIKDNDRLFLIFMIRELTFQKGNNLAKQVTCENCDHEFKIEFRATNSDKVKKTFVLNEMNEELIEFFNLETRTFDFDLGSRVLKLTPPSIGIQELFFEELRDRVNQNKKNPNMAFLKIIPFTLPEYSIVTNDIIEKKEKEFKEIDMDSFQILNYVVGLMDFGVKELVSNCPVCGVEVHTDMTFPGGASSIFTFSSPLEKLKKK